MTDPRDHVPVFSADVEPTGVGAEGASAQLEAFASEHGVGEGARQRLARVTADVLERLAAVGDAQPTLVEADIDQGTIQVLFTRALGSPDSVAEARTRLLDTAESCDDLAIHRVGDGSAIEVWVCFALG